MSRSAAGIKTGQRFQRTYVTLASLDLTAIYIRDTIMVDDTGANQDTALLLPKIGTAYAPVGKRVTIRKPSNVAQLVALTPDGKDAISAAAGAAYPSFGVAGASNKTALPASAANSVTIEATDMAITGSVQPNPLGGTPLTAGAWMIVASSRPSV